MSSTTTNMHAGSVRELAARENDGIFVQLLWNAERDGLTLVIEDTRTEEIFELQVQRDCGLDAFYHPYVYVAASAEAALPAGAEQVAA